MNMKLYLIGTRHKRTPMEEYVHDMHESSLRVYLNKYGPHFNNELAEAASKEMVNANGKVHTWTAEEVKRAMLEHGIETPEGATLGDIVYAANMLYADFSHSNTPDINYIKGAVMLAEDPDGYEGMIFLRWLFDVRMKDKHIKFYNFV